MLLCFGGDPAAVDPAAAHAAAISFDLAVIALLLLLGPRLAGRRSGRRLGVILAYTWAADPYSLFVLAHNANRGEFATRLPASGMPGLCSWTNVPVGRILRQVTGNLAVSATRSSTSCRWTGSWRCRPWCTYGWRRPRRL